ncbi:MAG: thioredoxin 2 [Paracoccaceae bacterium]|jgi:thioredoxin 2
MLSGLRGDIAMPGKKLTCLECGQMNRVPEDRLGSGAKCGTCGAALMPSKAVEVNPAILAKAAKNDDLPLIADFWAPWCGPCKMMAPEFSKAAKALNGQARLVKLNTEDHAAAGAKYNIRGIPTMVAFSGGREAKRQSGAMGEAQIVSWVRS